MENATLRLVIFSFVLSILFPMFAYTFTTFGALPENFDITLTHEQLINAGIELSDAQTFEVTYDAPPQEYTVKNTTMRVEWRKPALGSPYFANLQQSYIERLVGTWFFPIVMDVIIHPSQGSIIGEALVNSTVVNNFNTEYNWTRYWIVENSLMGFITAERDNHNISKAIFETGVVNVTIASDVFETGSDVNFITFANWYIKIVTGQGDAWGLPSFMTWVVRIFSFLTLLSAYLLATELIPG